MDFWYGFARSIVRLYIALCVDKIHILGKPEIPSGPKIIVANHTNISDAFILPCLIKEKIHFLIQAEAFTVPLVGRLLALADQIPVYVGRGREALDTAKEKLGLGHSVAIFPEGRLNDGKNFHRAGAGAALLAVESGAPLIPVGFYVPPGYARSIRGYFHNRHTVGRWQFGGDCFIRFGDVLEIHASISEKVNYRELRRLTEKIMARVAELVQQAQEEARRLNPWY